MVDSRQGFFLIKELLFLAYLCVWSLYACVIVCRGQKLTPGVIFYYSPPYPLRQTLSLNRELTVLDRAAQIPHLYPTTGITGRIGRCHNLLVFLCLEDWNISPNACAVGALPMSYLLGLNPKLCVHSDCSLWLLRQGSERQ